MFERSPEERISEEEKLPEWVDKIRGIYERVKGNEKAINEMTEYAREDLGIIEELHKDDKINEVRYWEEIRGWLEDNALLDSWWGVENIPTNNDLSESK